VPIAPSAEYYETAVAILRTCGFRPGAENIQVLVAMEGQEHGWDGGIMSYNNPLDVEEPGFGSTETLPDSAVRKYPTPEDGLKATEATLRDGRYPVLLAGLAQNNAGLVFSPAGRAELNVWGGDSRYGDEIAAVFADLQAVPATYYLTPPVSALGPPPAGNTASALWWARLEAWMQAELHGSADAQAMHALLVTLQEQVQKLGSQVRDLEEANAALTKRLALIARVAAGG